jgi:carbon monoxide dehydrogenase subunit G
MKKFALWIFYILLGLFLVFVAGGFVLPDKAHVARSTVINAPPEKIFAVVSDLKRTKDWSPWFAMDPQMAVTYEGDTPAVGQKMSWSSQKPDVGTGSQQTIGLTENKQVVAALDFGEMGQATATVDLVPEAAGTRVDWALDVPLGNIIERWFGLIMDRMVGPDFEKGLANLKAHVEAN